MACGPGTLELAHQVDEYVEIDALVSATQAPALPLMELIEKG